MMKSTDIDVIVVLHGQGHVVKLVSNYYIYGFYTDFSTPTYFETRPNTLFLTFQSLLPVKSKIIVTHTQMVFVGLASTD